VVVFEDFYFIGFQVRDGLPMIVRDDRVDLHQIRRDADDVYLFWFLCLRDGRRAALLGKNRSGQSGDEENRRQLFHNPENANCQVTAH